MVLAISIDSPFTHKVWQEGELSKMIPGGLPYPMLSDTGGRVGELYGVYDEDNGVDIRGRFLIDPDGILQAMEVLAPAVGRNVAEMIRQIRACQFVRQTGEATPAGWEPGKKSLKPGANWWARSARSGPRTWPSEARPAARCPGPSGLGS